MRCLSGISYAAGKQSLINAKNEATHLRTFEGLCTSVADDYKKLSVNALHLPAFSAIDRVVSVVSGIN